MSNEQLALFGVAQPTSAKILPWPKPFPVESSAEPEDDDVMSEDWSNGYDSGYEDGLCEAMKLIGRRLGYFDPDPKKYAEPLFMRQSQTEPAGSKEDL